MKSPRKLVCAQHRQRKCRRNSSRVRQPLFSSIYLIKLSPFPISNKSLTENLIFLPLNYFFLAKVIKGMVGRNGVSKASALQLLTFEILTYCLSNTDYFEMRLTFRERLNTQILESILIYKH